ncbi:histone deacetylase HDT [Acrasis kona]|uniref:Histone deacetylase HDT n=1 Tax=Acrasis kona TaxID=1008807 RepID=A0AAW2YM60_9EUKA
MSSLLSFFGQQVLPGKNATKIEIPEGVIVHVSQVAFASEVPAGEIARLFIHADDKKYAVCTLVGQTKEFANLDLNLDPETEFQFSVEGTKTAVHLTGYYNIMDEEIDSEDIEVGEEVEPEFNSYESDSDEELNGAAPEIDLSKKTSEELLNILAAQDDEDDDDYLNQSNQQDSEDDDIEEEYSDDENEPFNDEDLKAQIAAIQAQQTGGKKRKAAAVSNEKQLKSKKPKVEQAPAAPAPQKNAGKKDNAKANKKNNAKVEKAPAASQKNEKGKKRRGKKN